MRILVVDPAVHTPELAAFNGIVQRSRRPVEHYLPVLSGDSELPEPAPGCALILLGSDACVYEGRPWQEPLHRWLERHLEARTPILAFCYGHQLAAHLFGGRVEFLPEKRKEEGWRPVRLKEEPRLGWAPGQAPWVVTHREVVTDPGRLEVWCEGGDAPFRYDALRHPTRPLWTLQAHGEAGPSFCRHRGITPPAKEPTAGQDLIQAFIAAAEDLCS